MSEAIVKLTLYDVTLSMKYQTLKHVKTEFRAKFIAGPGGISNPLEVVKKSKVTFETVSCSFIRIEDA